MVGMTRTQSSGSGRQEDIPQGCDVKKTVLTCEKVPGQAGTGEAMSRASQEEGGRQSTLGAGPHKLLQHGQSSRFSDVTLVFGDDQSSRLTTHNL